MILPVMLSAVAGSILIQPSMASMSQSSTAPVQEMVGLPGNGFDFHGYRGHDFRVDGCSVKVVRPKAALPGRPWVWRTMFWDAFPGADIDLLGRGFYVAFIDVGNTFGCPDAMAHFDAFYGELTEKYHFGKRPALEGLSRGGLYAFRWASTNPDKVSCIYADAPVCDMKSWPGGKGKGAGSPADWQAAIQSYHFASEAEMMAFEGNPIDTLEALAKEHVPILEVYGLADKDVPPDENAEIVRTRYLKLGGWIAAIAKTGCPHHPHGLKDSTPIANFIVAHAAPKALERQVKAKAPKAGSLTILPEGSW